MRGKSIAYNEPGSYSGYFVLLDHLLKIGTGPDFFARACQSGAHQSSLQLLSQGLVDAACVDSVVLEDQGAQGFRSLLRLGPSPAPPALTHPGVSPEERRRLRLRLLKMHRDPLGCAILSRFRRLRFAPGEDYTLLAQRAQAAQHLRLAPQNIVLSETSV